MDLQAPANPPSPKEKTLAPEEEKKTILEGRPCAVCKSVHVACDRQRPCGRCKRLGKDAICQDPPAQRRGRRPVRTFGAGETPGGAHWNYSHFKFDVPKAVVQHNGPSAVVHDPRLPSLASGLNGLQFASTVPLPSTTPNRVVPQFQYPAYGLYGGVSAQSPAAFTMQNALFTGAPIAFAPVPSVPPQLAPNTAVANFDSNGSVIAATKEFAQLIGYSLEELLGLHMMNLHPPDLVDYYRTTVWKMVEGAPLNENTVSRVVDLVWITKQKERVTLTCQYRVFIKDRKMLSNSVTVLPTIRANNAPPDFTPSPQYRQAPIPSSQPTQTSAQSQATQGQQSPPPHLVDTEAGTPNSYFEVAGATSSLLPLLSSGKGGSFGSHETKGDPGTSPQSAGASGNHASGASSPEDPANGSQHATQWAETGSPESEG